MFISIEYRCIYFRRLLLFLTFFALRNSKPLMCWFLSAGPVMGRGPGCPVKTRGLPITLGGAAHIKAHISWSSVRPDQFNFESMRQGPTRPINC